MSNRLEEANKITDCLVLSNDKLIVLRQRLSEEFEKGLKDEKTSNVKMYLTYVRNIPTGKESGKFLALDLGGTNFRVLMVTLKGKIATMESDVYQIPEELMVSDGSKLFAFIVDGIYKFLQKRKIVTQRLPLGFTFSFPCHQCGLTQSRLVRWTKGYKCPGVVNEDVVRLLRDALMKKPDKNETYVDVVAIINDTTGTLLSCAHTNKNCRIGLIVGTGCNACYIEDLANVDKWPGNYTEPKQVLINTEWGAFGESNQLDIFETQWDREVDDESINKGKQPFEKKVAGMYLGEIVRKALLTICQKQLLFEGKIPQALKKSNAISSEDISHIEEVKDGDKAKLDAEMKRIFDDVSFDDIDSQIVKTTCARVSTRAAHLVAMGLSAILNKMKREYSVIGYDGSLIRFHPHFKNKLQQKLRELTNPGYRFELMLSEDGSGIGAAIVAAVVYKEKRPIIIKKGRKVYELSVYRR